MELIPQMTEHCRQEGLLLASLRHVDASIFFGPVARSKKILFLLFTFLCTVEYSRAQHIDRPPIFYSDYKGLSAHVLVQPAWLYQPVFHQQLQDLGYPSPPPFGLHLGAGASWLFKTGTSVGLEFAYLSSTQSENGKMVKVQPHMYLLNMKQYVADMVKARLYLSASYLALEQQYTISRTMPAVTSLAQAITVSNGSSFIYHSEGLGGGLGITFKGENDKSRRFTDFVEAELGYRFGVGKPFFSVESADFDGLPDDHFRQYYFSMRAGIFMRAKRR